MALGVPRGLGFVVVYFWMPRPRIILQGKNYLNKIQEFIMSSSVGT